MLSRTHPDLVRRLFENEVMEVREGIVEIRGIAREAGSRTKIAVFSNDENVDPVGACVGLNGTRVSAVVDELGGEKIDISYPACELLCGIITCFLYHIYGSSLHFLETEILYLIMLGISLCDLEAFAVPDLYIFLGILNRIIFLYLDGASMNNYLMCLRRGLSAGIPILVVTAIISFMTGQEVMGAGDIELFILFGSYLSVYENALAVFISCVCGILMYSLFYRRKGELPFCPCICIAYFALIIFRL